MSYIYYLLNEICIQKPAIQFVFCEITFVSRFNHFENIFSDEFLFSQRFSLNIMPYILNNALPIPFFVRICTSTYSIFLFLHSFKSSFFCACTSLCLFQESLHLSFFIFLFKSTIAVDVTTWRVVVCGRVLLSFIVGIFASTDIARLVVRVWKCVQFFVFLFFFYKFWGSSSMNVIVYFNTDLNCIWVNTSKNIVFE